MNRSTKRPSDTHSPLSRRSALRRMAGGIAGLAVSPLLIRPGTAAPVFQNRQPTEPVRPVRVAMLGAAHIHAPDFANRLSRLDAVTTTRIYDPNPNAARARADVTGATVAERPDEILTDPTLDGIIIASETVHHQKWIDRTLAAGHHLFVEKPLGMNGDQSESMAHRIRHSDQIFQTGYFMRSAGQNQQIRQWLADGVLGKITRLRLSNVHHGAIGGWFDEEWRWMADKERSGVGAFGDLGSHVLDLLVWFMQEDTAISATGVIGQGVSRYPGCDEYGEGMIRFASGAVAVVAGGWVDHANPHQIEISGTEGHLRVTNGELFATIPALGLDGDHPVEDLPEAWDHPLELFLRAIAGEENLPLIEVDQTARVDRLIQSIYRGDELGQWTPV
ncbi:MAG: Gfo/Idh/MocA family oxidoreductase [Balneolaceae bacterium]